MTRWRSPLDNISHLLSRINRQDRVHLIYGDLRDFIVYFSCRKDS